VGEEPRGNLRAPALCTEGDNNVGLVAGIKMAPGREGEGGRGGSCERARRHEEVVHPHVLIGRRPVADIGGDDELMELQVRPRTRPEQDVMPVDDRCAVEPVLDHAVRDTDAADDGVELQVRFDVG